MSKLVTCVLHQSIYMIHPPSKYPQDRKYLKDGCLVWLQIPEEEVVLSASVAEITDLQGIMYAQSTSIIAIAFY